MKRDPNERQRSLTARWRECEALLAELLVDLAIWAHGLLPRSARRRLDTGDLVQEAVGDLVANVEPGGVGDRGRYWSYLTKAIRSKIADEIRRSQLGEIARLGSEQREVADRTANAEHELLEEEARVLFYRALCELSEDDQHLIVGRARCGIPYALLAANSGRRSAGAARVAAHRAAVRLTAKVCDLRNGPPRSKRRPESAETPSRRVEEASSGFDRGRSRPTG